MDNSHLWRLQVDSQQSHKDRIYLLPKAEDIFSLPSGGKLFTTLDLSRAYNQISLDEEFQKLVVVNTQNGLYKYKRLPFGIASAPAIFSKSYGKYSTWHSQVYLYLK